MITDFDIIEVRSEPEALLLEGRLIKQYKPRYNTSFIDDKRFLLVRVDLAAELPRFALTRLRKDDRSRYFGPFAHSALLRRTLAELRRRFGVLLGDARPVRTGDGTYRLYDDVRAEIYGHANEVTAADYRAPGRRRVRVPRGQEPRMARDAARRDAGRGGPAGVRAGGRRCATSSRRWRRRWPRRAASSARRRCRAPTRSRCACWPRRCGCPRRRRTSSASTSRTSRARSSSPRWCISPPAGPTRTSTAASRSRASSATTTFAP